MFYKGQEVIYVGGGNTLKKGKTYVILDVIYNPCNCFKSIIYVGAKQESKGSLFCPKCNKRHHITDNIYTNSKSFVPVDYTKAQKVTFTEIEEVVPMFSN